MAGSQLDPVFITRPDQPKRFPARLPELRRHSGVLASRRCRLHGVPALGHERNFSLNPERLDLPLCWRLSGTTANGPRLESPGSTSPAQGGNRITTNGFIIVQVFSIHPDSSTRFGLDFSFSLSSFPSAPLTAAHCYFGSC